jgi:hypothetical protein
LGRLSGRQLGHRQLPPGDLATLTR